MNDSVLKGMGFGLISGIITTLGLIVGLNSGTHSRSVVIGGIFVIAIADALSDALGMHISEESIDNNLRHVWTATIATFFSKFVFAMTFTIPVFLLELQTAIFVGIIWGLLLITIFSHYIARKQGESSTKVVIEHLLIAIAVIIITNYVGAFVSTLM